MRRLSIRARLTAWYVLLLALILTAFSLVLYAALSDQLARSLDDRLRLEAEALASSLGQSEIKIEDEGDEGRALRLPPSDFLIRLLDKKGREASASDALRGAPIGTAALDAARRGGAFYTVSLNDDSQARAFLIPLLHEGKEIIGFLEVAEPLAAVETTQRSLALILMVAVPATLALASVGGLFIADRALRPIDAITREAQRIGEQHLDRRLNLELPDDEVGRLARTFDAMLARLDAAFQRQRQFTADASHELRTPLTVMKGSIGVTLNRPRNAGEYQAALAQLESEVDRLTRLTEDLLLLARADAGRPLIRLHDIDLVTVVGGVVDDLRPLAEAKALAFSLTAPDSLPLRGDPDRLRRAFSNLIDNAIKYTSRGRVDVRVEPIADPAGARVAIADTGPGIAEEHLPRVFERFYRADESRAREQGGSGLGLAIARSIVGAHGGAIDISSRLGAGTTVSVTLPDQRA